MRIRDWSSDVCSSDLQRRDEVVLHQVLAAPGIDEAGSPGELREQAPVQDAGGLGRQRQQADQDLDLRQQRGEAVRPAVAGDAVDGFRPARSEEHTSELQSLMRISYAVFCLKQQKFKIAYT